MNPELAIPVAGRQASSPNSSYNLILDTGQICLNNALYLSIKWLIRRMAIEKILQVMRGMRGIRVRLSITIY
jgi:hypothetical protein